MTEQRFLDRINHETAYEEKIHYLVNQMLASGQDDDTKANYTNSQDVFAKIK